MRTDSYVIYTELSLLLVCVLQAGNHRVLPAQASIPLYLYSNYFPKLSIRNLENYDFAFTTFFIALLAVKSGKI